MADPSPTPADATRSADLLAAPALECAWCGGPLDPRARKDSIYCRKSCRQAAHRFRRGYVPRPAATDRPLSLAYADPPYPGLAERHYRDHPDFAGEVDHYDLVARLEAEYPDGWALSTSSRALPAILRYDTCPTDVLVASWHRGPRSTRSALPLQAWEPVIYRGGRQLPPADGPTERTDALEYVARARTTDPKRVTGAKPAKFLWWMFDLLGALPGDTLADLFPGSGGVARAWRIYTAGPPRPHFTTPRVAPAQLDLSTAITAT